MPKKTIPVPTIEDERYFLAQCDYVNKLTIVAGRHARALLYERGWTSKFEEIDQDVVWTKQFPDGDVQHLSEWDAYDYEQEYSRNFFRASKLAMRPRRK